MTIRSALALVLLAAGVARAGEPMDDVHAAAPDAPRAPKRDAADVAREGTFLPSTLSARVGDQRVAAVALGGYDMADSQGALASFLVEGALWNRLALRAGVDYLPATGAWSPSVGLRAGLLRQERHGVDLGFSAVYKQRGYTQSSGEFEFALAVDHRWRTLGLYANVVFGTGIDPRERDGELRAALLWFAHSRVSVGVDARARFDLGDDTPGREQDRLKSTIDFLGGPLVSVAVSHFVLLAQAGVHVLQADDTAAGFFATGGAGACF
jgi:hypothetical protein